MTSLPALILLSALLISGAIWASSIVHRRLARPHDVPVLHASPDGSCCEIYGHKDPTFVCAQCKRRVGWCMGATDDFSGLCTPCWNQQEHKDIEFKARSSRGTLIQQQLERDICGGWGSAGCTARCESFDACSEKGMVS